MDIERVEGLNVKDLSENLVNTSQVSKIRFSPLCRQILASLGTLMVTTSSGMVVGYSAILLPELQQTNSLFEISAVEASWIASMAPLPMAIGCLLGGILMEKFGRRTTHFILNVPFVIGWAMIAMSSNLFWLLTGRFITGLCVGLSGPPGPTYLGEISAPKYRGFFLATTTFGVALGVLLTHVLGLYFTWKMNAMICGTLPFISYVIMIYVPESPSWLLKNNHIEEASNAFRWLRGADEQTLKEFESMVDAKTKADSYHDLDKTKLNGIGKLKEIVTLKQFYQPTLILSVYFATLQFSGANAVAFYTVSILKESLGNNINEYTATLAIDFVRLFASLIGCIVVKTMGRRPLTILSGTSTAICLFGLSLYLYSSASNAHLKSLSGIPLTLFVFFILFVSIGITPLPWCLTGELFPLQFRAIGSAFVTFFNFFCFFIVVKTSPFFFAAYGGVGTFFIYGILCLAGTIFLTVFLPETKNKSLQEIEDSYHVKKIIKIGRNKVQP